MHSQWLSWQLGEVSKTVILFESLHNDQKIKIYDKEIP